MQLLKKIIEIIEDVKNVKNVKNKNLRFQIVCLILKNG